MVTVNIDRLVAKALTGRPRWYWQVNNYAGIARCYVIGRCWAVLGGCWQLSYITGTQWSDNYRPVLRCNRQVGESYVHWQAKGWAGIRQLSNENDRVGGWDGIDRQVAEYLLTGRLPGEMVMVTFNAELFNDWQAGAKVLTDRSRRWYWQAGCWVCIDRQVTEVLYLHCVRHTS